ncbi:CLUH isoform 10, partial [Pan troglodytes]
PPPGNRKMHGDLMYLFVITAEDRQVSITASTRGFYLNQSTAYHFNPKPASPRFLSHSLVELLNQISPTFKKNFAVLQKKRCTAGQPPRRSMPWIACAQRTPTPRGWATRSTFLDRPETGMRSCRRRGSCLARTCLSGCSEKGPYSRCTATSPRQPPGAPW